MRWDEQRVENDLRLPGVGDGTVVRTFDAPEAMGVNFHEVRARSALNQVPGGRYGFNWTINPYRGCSHACVYCFARRTHTYLEMNAGRDFEREIVVKVNVPELLRAELVRPSWKRELVALGTNTDPYQWVESRYRMMPDILAALEEAETPVSVLTKSPLVMRDVEIFARMAKRLPVSVNLSVPTLDEDAWRATEPHTPSPAARLDAVAELRRRGIESGVLIAPLMPGINDSPEAGAADRRARPRGRRDLPWRRRPPPPRRGQGRLLRLARGQTPGPASPLRGALHQQSGLPSSLRALQADPQSLGMGPFEHGKRRSSGGWRRRGDLARGSFSYRRARWVPCGDRARPPGPSLLTLLAHSAHHACAQTWQRPLGSGSSSRKCGTAHRCRRSGSHVDRFGRRHRWLLRRDRKRLVASLSDWLGEKSGARQLRRWVCIAGALVG